MSSPEQGHRSRVFKLLFVGFLGGLTLTSFGAAAVLPGGVVGAIMRVLLAGMFLGSAWAGYLVFRQSWRGNNA